LTSIACVCTVPLDIASRNIPRDDPSSNEEATDAFLDWLRDIADPRERYRRATEELEKHRRAVEMLSSVRAAAASDAYEAGGTVRGLAAQLGVSPARVHQLIQEASARAAEEKKPRRPKGRQKGGS
jgi:hypothetical protein